VQLDLLDLLTGRYGAPSPFRCFAIASRELRVFTADVWNGSSSLS
jgi:hypothetical protein